MAQKTAEEAVKTLRMQDIVVFLHEQGFEILEVEKPSYYGKDRMGLRLAAWREKGDISISVLGGEIKMLEFLGIEEKLKETPHTFEVLEVGIYDSGRGFDGDADDLKVYKFKASEFQKEVLKLIDSDDGDLWRFRIVD